MGLFDKFFNKNTNWKQTLVRDMMRMSEVDGSIDDKELMIATKIAESIEISEDDFGHVLKNYDNIKSIYPTEEDDKNKYLSFLTHIAMADGRIDKSEESFLIGVGKEMGIDENYVSDLIIAAKHLMNRSDSKDDNSSSDDNSYIDDIAENITGGVVNRISSYNVAMQFVLEELDAARHGNTEAQDFVKNSGFSEDEYQNSMRNSFNEVDGPDGPQQFLLTSLMSTVDKDSMVKVRTKVVDNVMQIWKLGKYADDVDKLRLIYMVNKVFDLKEGVFANINNDLNECMTDKVTDKMIIMAYGYARRAAAAGLYLQGVFNKASYEQASRVFLELQLQTGQTVNFQEEAFAQALELLQSYDKNITKQIVSVLVATAENKETVSAQDRGISFTYEQLLSMFTANK